ncbi:MAG: cytidine deaminase [Firmicutes bacterium]|nr:cytidine deaminase [Bacillota bacterium]
MTNEQLCQEALQAMKKAYAPYSGYKVGAALLLADGKVYTGCNIENSSFTPTICAERTAFFKAVSERKEESLPEFVRIAVCGGEGGKITGAFPPCGVCRQVMSEFCTDSFEILMITSADPVQYETCLLPDLLPFRFSPDYLENKG